MSNSALVVAMLAVIAVASVYGAWYFLAMPRGLKVGVVYFPVHYNRQSALQQLRQIYGDGFRVWAMDISYYSTEENDRTLEVCLDEAKRLGMSLMLRLIAPFREHPDGYMKYLDRFAHYFDSFHILQEIDRFLNKGMSVDEVEMLFDEWLDVLKKYVAKPFVLTSFVVGSVVGNRYGVLDLLNGLDPHLDAVGLSVYPHDMVEVSLPPVFNLLRQHTLKPIWVTEIGSSDGDWLVNQLSIIKNNGVEVAIVWIWETFWGGQEYNIKNTEVERKISEWIKANS